MGLDPEILKQLIFTFQSELNERLQIITNGLLALEKGNLSDEQCESIINDIFRSAHNIKGTAGSLDITDISKIAHHLESIFSSIQHKVIKINPILIDLCLEAADKMKLAMDSFSEKTALPFDMDNLLIRLEQAETATAESDTKTKTTKQRKPTTQKNISKRKTDQVIKPILTEDINTTVRVPISNIDRISVLMEEIQANKIVMDNHYDDLMKLNTKISEFSRIWKQILLFLKNYLTKTTGDGLEKSYLAGSDNYAEIANALTHMQKDMHLKINELALLYNSLQDEIRTLRLIPAANFLYTLPRYVRELCHDLNKKVELKITGEEVKIDKMILEGLKDPIIHIIRNSIDHGIESPEERKKLNKSEVGHITIDLTEESGQIIIRIADDGRGIDLKQIAEIALKKNFITKAELGSLTDNEISELIFRPGFSSKEIITDISGRGVGLDVVKNNVENLNGQLNFSTEINAGTTLELRTPLTLASERGFIVSAGGQLFVIPTNAVQRVELILENEIINIEGSQAVMLDKHPILLHSLIDVLRLEQKELPNRKQLSILFVRHGKYIIAILVDEIIGEREIVLKPLQSPLTKIACIAGGTLSGNNQVIIVLDPHDLVHAAMHITKTHRINLQTESAASISAKPHILVVDDSITTRALEKNILESKNYKVTTAVNGKEAWDLLQKQNFSLIITDIVMPIMDGFALTEQVKKSEKLRHVPVIIVTSLGSDNEKKRGIDVGADAYIIKSEFESGILLDIVERLV